MTREELAGIREGDVVFVNEHYAHVPHRGKRGTVFRSGDHFRVRFHDMVLSQDYPLIGGQDFLSLDFAARERMERDARLAHAMEEAEYYVRLTGLGERG